MGKFLQKNHIVPGVWPVDFNDATPTCDYVSMKNYKHLTIHIMLATAGGTSAVTVSQAKDVAATGAKTLAFIEYLMSGSKWKFTGKSAADFAVGETVTGAGGASGVVYEVGADYLLRYTVKGTAVVHAATLTSGTSGATATANGIGVNEDIMLPLACVNTFTMPAVVNKCYAIEIEASMLDLTNDFDCVAVAIVDPGAAMLGSVVYVLSEPRYAGIPMETAIYD